MYRVTQKSKPLPNYHEILLSSPMKLDFKNQLWVWRQHYVGIKYSICNILWHHQLLWL